MPKTQRWWSRKKKNWQSRLNARGGKKRPLLCGFHSLTSRNSKKKKRKKTVNRECRYTRKEKRREKKETRVRVPCDYPLQRKNRFWMKSSCAQLRRVIGRAKAPQCSFWRWKEAKKKKSKEKKTGKYDKCRLLQN